MSSKPYDCLIIGGGPAGLTAALTLARQLHTCVVFDDNDYRNAKADHMHMVLTWDHQSPAEYLAAARKNILSNYQTVQFANLSVKSVADASSHDRDSLFQVTDQDAKVWLGRKLILATGCHDVMLDLEGYAECWASGIFQCLFCHGYEERKEPSSGVLAVGDVASPPLALHFARNAAQLTKSTTIYTNGDAQLAGSIEKVLDEAPKDGAYRVKVDSRVIKRLEKGTSAATVVLHFADGSDPVTEGFIGHRASCRLRGPFAQDLGLELTPQGDVKASVPFYQTSVRGCFVAGDASSPMKTVNGALFSGGAAAAGASAQLQADLVGHPSLV